jgi:hypothetical protein
VRLGLATLLLNFAVAASDGRAVDDAGVMQLLSCCDELLGCLPASEAQAAARALLALGTLLTGPRGASSKGVARDLGLPAAVERWCGAAGGEAAGIAAEVAAALR